ncbi:MAG: UDP-N-acetylmuramoyl-L-alanyl-D-glutamate--2,6-diaminopimelate ligase, partial [Alistipes sp.]|nr:UDP-N-acetylmuramoyl-L-alanyl-D-glutamate--2,6-diaminopimelate ligase [Alistipes sp.]
MKQLSTLLLSTAVDSFITEGDPEIRALHYDSRQIMAGDCFFAVRGTLSDGHDYISSAIEKGAVAVVCETLPTEQKAGVSYVVVENSNSAMADMAAAFYDYPSEEL